MSDADEAYEAARRRIAEAKAEEWTELRLYNDETRALIRLPPEIAELSDLKLIDLTNTGVSDLSPLSGLSGLTMLGLDDTGVTDLSPLSGLSGLTMLGLGRTGVSDLSPLSDLSGLTTLGLNGTRVTDLSPLSGLSGLTELGLSGTGVKDISPLSGLTDLTSLWLSGTGVTDLSPLSGLTNLTSLWLNDTGVTDLSPLSGLTGLTLLSLNDTGVTDLSPLSGLSGLTTLWLNGTGLTDLSPLSGLSGLTTLWLADTGVTDLSPLSGLLGLIELRLDDTSVTDLSPLKLLARLTDLALGGASAVDLRPIRTLWALVEGPDARSIGRALWHGITFKNSAAARADPRIAEIADIEDHAERARTLFDYLKDWEPPADFGPDGPAADPLIDVVSADGRLEIAASHPDEAERDDTLKRALHERLKARAVDLERLAGNQFHILCAKARSFAARLDRPFEDLDMLNIHLDVEELTRIHGRGAEREGDEPFPQEVRDALADVVSNGPGLTLDNEQVERLEDRKRRYAEAPRGPEAQATHDALSAVIAGAIAAIGDRLSALERQLLEREKDAAGAVVQEAVHRNILIRVARGALNAGGAIVLGAAGSALHQLIVTHWPLIVETAALYGAPFQAWFLTVMSRVPEFAALVASVPPGIIPAPGRDEDEDPDA